MPQQSLHKGWAYKTDTPIIEVVHMSTKWTRLLEASSKVTPNSSPFLPLGLIRRTWQAQFRWCNFTSIIFYLVTWATIMCCLFLSLKFIFSFSSIIMWIIVICLMPKKTHHGLCGPILQCNCIVKLCDSNSSLLSKLITDLCFSISICGWILLT